MKKYLYPLVWVVLALVPLGAGAATVNLSGVNIALPNGITISVAGSQSQAESVTINTNNVSFSMSEGEAMYITSSDRYTLTNSLGVLTTCDSTQSSVALAVHSGEGTKTITVTPSTTLCSSGTSSGNGGGGVLITGGGGGGGGGGYAAPAAPSTTPAPQGASSVVQGTPAASVSPVFNSDLLIGSRGNDVTRLQTLLSQDATVYPEKLLTGYFGAKTVAAVKRFQKKYGITPANGRVGPKTRSKLNEIYGGQATPTAPLVATPSPVPSMVSPVFNSDLSFGMKGDDVRRLQELLKQDASVYPEGIANGNYGSLTVAAVRRFQAKYGIAQIGKVGPATRAKLNEIYGGQSATPSSSSSTAGTSAPAPQAQTQPAQAPVSTPVVSGKQVAVQLKEQNSSGESGTATLTQVDGTASVKIQVVRTGPAPLVDTPQPAHIHRGNCGELGNVTYQLSALINGKSETTLPVSLDTILTQLPLAVNIHKSVSEAQIYVACGNITN